VTPQDASRHAPSPLRQLPHGEHHRPDIARADACQCAAALARAYALRSKKRDSELLKEARFERGKLLFELGKTAQGKKDLEHVYANDPKYRDIAELVRD
jgi:hypothetical protein